MGTRTRWIQLLIPPLSFAALCLGIAAIIVLLYRAVTQTTSPEAAETQLGLVIALAASSVMILFFLMAAGYTLLGLSNPGQALGLPEGSIRALISIILIVMFTILGIYYFRSVAGQGGIELQNVAASRVLELADNIASATPNDDGSFDIRLRFAITDQGNQLALQLITILGTLVTAVSAFYFGASSVNSARNAVLAARDRATEPTVSVGDITPSSALVASGIVRIVVTGNGFANNARVQLRQLGPPPVTLDGTIVGRPNPTTIVCDVDFTGTSPGSWDVEVTNPDGTSAAKPNAFTTT